MRIAFQLVAYGCADYSVRPDCLRSYGVARSVFLSTGDRHGQSPAQFVLAILPPNTSGRLVSGSHHARWTITLSIVVWATLMMTTAGAEYPERQIRLIVPSAPGGAPDVSNRLLAAELSKQMGQQFVIDNRPTGNGTVATDAIAKAAPDGYTMGQGNIMTMAIARNVLGALPYDVDRDLRMVVQVVSTSNLLGVTPLLPIKSVRELIDYAKANPGKLSYASAGNGSSMHLSGEMFKQMTGTQMLHVPYKAAQQAITEMIGGQVHLMFDNIASILPHVQAGRVRGIAVTTLKRSPAIPELPTVSEAGVPGFEVVP